MTKCDLSSEVDLTNSGVNICTSSISGNDNRYRCSGNCNVFKNRTFSKTTKVRKEWSEWAVRTSEEIRQMLVDIHKSHWTTEILHIEHVKSYAPHIDHIVLDLKCTPGSRTS